ncbi:hypothetical protein [Myxococcus sp. NMCA1]|uniref:hypothetical protein n=1 Tax=Myxococcus sp. NMCA1 TaxID=2996785 RepID=UPI0022863976|nr:hypothetical protein [Myxococcus sp. NMCA1]WAM23834.1 hypothetical protein OZ403_25165 [Myxococcus sp. NMCA1]
MKAARHRPGSGRRLRGRGLPRAARRDSVWVVVRFSAHLEAPHRRRLTRLASDTWAYVHLRRQGNAEEGRA